MTYDELLADNTALRVERTTLVAKLSAVQASNEALALELARLKRQSFGVKSERRPDNPAQPGLFGEPEPPPAPEAAPAPPLPPPRRATPHGRRRPDREPDEQILVPAPTSCTRCGGGDLREISASTATRLEWRRGHFVEIRVRRPSCACAQCNNVETAPEPSSFALPRSLAGNGLVARVVIDKFLDNIPLNRQVDRFARDGMTIHLSTLCDIVRRSAGLLNVIVRAMTAEMVTSEWIQTDATGLPILDGSQKKTKSGHLFVFANPKHVVYHATASKHGAHVAAFLKGFKGILLADGGSEFNEAVALLQLLRAACWAHARRYFFDAQAEPPVLAAEAMALIGVLFEIEREIKDADLETRRRRRDTDTCAALVKIHDWLTRHVHAARPRSAIGKAIQYTLNQWAALTVCADHPEIPIHNNTCELRLRQGVTGRKNYLFAGSEGGAASAATLYSIVASCKLHGLDPWVYLNDVLSRINDYPINRVIELSPAYVAQAR